MDEWPTWAKTNLKPSDVLVVEATTNTWWFYDQTHESGGQLLVADLRKIVWIAQTRVKTDAHDVIPALAAQVSPRKAARNCAMCWSKPYCRPDHNLGSWLANAE